jgi:MarR family transcriptional regulator, organic hydroperoxide resistance regulator
MTEAHDADLTLEAQLCFAVYAAAHAYTRRYKPLLDPLGLTYPQYLVVLILLERDGLTVGAIANRLGLDSGTLTPLLKRMERMGMVSRQRDKSDERQVLISLTANGKDLRPAVEAVHRAIGCSFDGSPTDAGELMRQLIELRRTLDGATRDSA